MAQAARLNLRMQKELKLLLSDPPPGASFPSLSGDASSSSLTSIDAEIQGPAGTVYADGLFKIKIQIPERYPFQPPIVTFATPIYHPNIDNGGRICLDILNLPPKGAWQPSLNISTVLTSIGSLLSEPNPDDGLMHEASTEYKYNRQAFDEKARSMTEKFARAGASESVSGSPPGTQTNQSAIQTKLRQIDDPECRNDNIVSDKMPSLSNRKLSLTLGSSIRIDTGKDRGEIPTTKIADKMEDGGSNRHGKAKLSLKYSDSFCIRNVNMDNEMPNQSPLLSETQSAYMECGKSPTLVQIDDKQGPSESEDLKLTSFSVITNAGNPKPLEQSSDYLLTSKRKEDVDEKLLVPQSAVSKFNSIVSNPSMTSSQIISRNEVNPHKVPIDKFEKVRRKRLGLASRKPSFPPLGLSQQYPGDNKENEAPKHSLSSSSPDKHSVMPSSSLSVVAQVGDRYVRQVERHATDIAYQVSGTATRQPLEPQPDNQSVPHSKLLSLSCSTKLNDNKHPMKVHDDESTGGMEEQEAQLPIAETVIVLDSEDSEDERKVSSRSKLSLARKCLPRKRKAKT